MMKARTFRSNGEYLDAEFRWLQAKITLVNAERDLRQGGYVHKHPDDCIVAVRSREADLRQKLDERLSAHRASGQFELGLDRVVREHDLTVEERIVLLVLTAPAISENVGDEVLRGLGTSGGAWVSAGDMATILDVPDIDSWLRVRRLFTQAGRLRSQGLVVVREGHGDEGARTQIEGVWFLTGSAFAAIVGQPVEGEAETDEGVG